MATHYNPDNHSALINSLKDKEKIKILFVCLGNICRSPAAEGITRALAVKRGIDGCYEFDSAGLYGGHAGELPDRRMRIHAFQRGYNLVHHSRPVRTHDFEEFDLIIGMDDSNISGLKRLARTPEEEAKIMRMTDFCLHHPGADHVPDPYYEGAEGFEIVLDLLEDACTNLLDQTAPSSR